MHGATIKTIFLKFIFRWFTKLRKATITSICLSVCPHGTTRFPLSVFSLSMILEYLSKICRQKFKFHWTLIRINGTVYEDQYIFLIISHSVLLRMRNVLEKMLYWKSKHTFYTQYILSENRAVYEIMWKHIVETDRPQTTIQRMHISCWITT
jgi:hypothetical protein